MNRNERLKKMFVLCVELRDLASGLDGQLHNELTGICAELENQLGADDGE